jgi:CHAT domain-containing protein
MKVILKLIMFAFPFLLFGCGYLMLPSGTKLLVEARYFELQKLMEEKVNQSDNANTQQLSALCTAYSALKRYDRLFDCCDRLESNIRRGEKSVYDSFLMGIIMKGICSKDNDPGDVSSEPFHFRAQAYIELGQYERAIEEAKKACDIAPHGENQKFNRINAWGSLSLAYALNENREEALRTVAKLKLFQRPGYENRHLNNTIVKTYMALKEYQKALDILLRDDKYDENLGKDNFLIQASFIIVTGGGDVFIGQDLPHMFLKNKCLMETGRIDEAKIGYDELITIPQTRDSGEIYWMILFDRGRIAEQDGNLKEAIDFYRQAINIIEQQRSSIHTEASKIGFVGDKQSVYHRLVSALFLNGQYATAFEYVERSKSRALVDMLATKQNFAIKSGDEQAIKNLLAQNTSKEAELMVQDPSLNKTEMRSMMVKDRDKLTEQSPELASLVSVASLATNEIQSNIPQNEILIEYYYAGNDMFAFILSAQKLKAIKLNSDNLADDIHKFRRLLNSPSSSGYRESSLLLYDRLIRPIESSLDNRNLIIVPHGLLHYLPFNALHNGKRFLIEQYSIRILPSASVIKYLQAKKSSKPGDILVFGDPLYNLEGAQKESIAVAKTQTRSKVLLGKEATETALNKYGRGFNYIHFATHGKFNADSPLSSALLLAADSESDGMLTVDKLYSMKLDADLVTLSACETGLSKIANGDDSVGLSRGFLYAGSSSIVASLWKVDDLATSYLMTLFYSNMKLTDKREALRSAQLTTMDKYPHPFYWASFQLTGNVK